MFRLFPSALQLQGLLLGVVTVLNSNDTSANNTVRGSQMYRCGQGTEESFFPSSLCKYHHGVMYCQWKLDHTCAELLLSGSSLPHFSKLLTFVVSFCNYVTQTRHTYECWEELLLQHVDCMHAILRNCRAFTADPFCSSTRTSHATCHHSSPELSFMKMKIVVGNKLQCLSSHQGPPRYSYIAV